MVVSQYKETPIETPKHYNPNYWDPQYGTPNFGKPPYWAVELGFQGSGFKAHARGFWVDKLG